MLLTTVGGVTLNDVVILCCSETFDKASVKSPASDVESSPSGVELLLNPVGWRLEFHLSNGEEQLTAALYLPVVLSQMSVVRNSLVEDLSCLKS